MELKWKISRGIIEKVFFNGVNLIVPWGFETSDSYSFYSQETKGNRCSEAQYMFENDERKNTGKIEVKMQEWSWKLDIEETISENKIIRKHVLITQENSYFFDYVQRYRFDKNYFYLWKIDGKEIKHTNTNIYYQYKAQQIELLGDHIKVIIDVLGATTSEVFEPYMYIRDYKDEWVVHVRLWPKKRHKEVLKLCTFWYNKAIPQVLADFFLSFSCIKKYTWVRWEVRPYTRPMSLLSPCSYPEVLLQKWEILFLESQITFLEI